MERESPEVKEVALSPEGEPKFEFTFYFAPHASEQDAEKIEELFAKADIYAPEEAGWNQERAILWNRVAQGTLDLEKVKAVNPFHERVLQIVYNSKKPIIFFDVMEEHMDELKNQLQVYDNGRERAKAYFLSGRFDEALQQVKEYRKVWAHMIKSRDYYITQAITKVFPEMAKKHLDIAEKMKENRPLKVLVTLGSMHTSVYHGVREAGVGAKREFAGEMPFIFRIPDETSRMYLFGKEPNDELVARGFFEETLSRWSFGEGRKSVQDDNLLRKFVSRFSLDQIRRISTQVGVMGKSLLNAVEAEAKSSGFQEEFREIFG